MSRRDRRTAEEVEEDLRREHAERMEARRHETLTRREVLDAIDTATYEFPTGTPNREIALVILAALTRALQ